MTGPAAAPGKGRLDALQGLLEHRFHDRGLLERALTHTDGSGQNFQRLEFVGDRVLALVVTDMLMERFPDADEGELARRHAGLVNRDTLADIGAELSLPDFIRTDSGDTANRDSVIADCCEAIIGAIYRDGGLAAAHAFVGRLWRPRIKAGMPQVPTTDLQERLQERGLPLPKYRLVEQGGTGHEPSFTIEVKAKGLKPVRATGPSKLVARRRAAKRMLKQIAGGA